MMKCIVETTGEFMLLTNHSEEIPAHRPAVIIKDAFVEIKLERGELRVLAQVLPKEATDGQFVATLREFTKGIDRRDRKQAKKYKEQVKAAVLAYTAEFGYDLFGEQLEVEKK